MLILGATVVGIFIVITYGMTSPDRKEVMLAILGWPFFGILGWFFAFLIFFVCRYTHTLREKTHTDEMNRAAEVKNQAVQAALPFELKSSESTPTQPE